jgi:hypothetical protein
MGVCLADSETWWFIQVMVGETWENQAQPAPGLADFGGRMMLGKNVMFLSSATTLRAWGISSSCWSDRRISRRP